MGLRYVDFETVSRPLISLGMAHKKCVLFETIMIITFIIMIITIMMIITITPMIMVM